jgi:hypothetical protein
MTKKATKVQPALASSLLLVVAIFSALLLPYSRTSTNPLLQALTMLVSMGLLFFSSHPLGHFLVARAEGVRTEYVFVGRSDFRKLKLKPMSLVGALVPTVGTKLRKDELASLPPRKRGYIFGAGVIVSNALMGMELAYVLVSGFGWASIALGVLFFSATVATETLFSTKVGDLAKMRNEFNKPQ